jgi:hypothetical protein
MHGSMRMPAAHRRVVGCVLGDGDYRGESGREGTEGE